MVIMSDLMSQNEIAARLSELISRSGLKHWSRAARRDEVFVASVEAAWSRRPGSDPDEEFPVKVYYAASGDDPVCANGRARKFDNIERGWRFCGSAGRCDCARAHVSQSVSKAKRATSEADRAATNARRAATNLERYGHENVGQSEAARAAHAATYADPDRVAQANERYAATMQERYGVRNGFLLPAVTETRPLIASRLTPEARASSATKRRQFGQDGGYLAKAHQRLSAKFKSLGFTWLAPIESYAGIYGQNEDGERGRATFPFRCDRCSLEFQARIYDGAGPACPACDARSPSYRSNEEDAVADFVASLGVDVLRPRRSILGTMELDIYLPEKRIAIEYGGLYWHSEIGGGKGPNYHLDKLDACEAKGIRLVTLFSDEWLFKNEIVKSRLAQIVGAAGPGLAARKTVCRSIDGSSAAAFLDRHHIQGAGTAATHCYGLFPRDEPDRLVAVMTFGHKRRSNNQQPGEGEWELYRFASDGRVTGGASKLFRAFVRAVQPTLVVTFADRRWGTGRVYSELGFRFEANTKPGYWYTHRYVTRQYRFTFAKHKLRGDADYDDAKTEIEIMRDRGYDRIFDCGNARYVWRP